MLHQNFLSDVSSLPNNARLECALPAKDAANAGGEKKVHWIEAMARCSSMGIESEMSLTFSTPRDHVLTLISPSTATSTAALIKLTKGSGGNPLDVASQGESSLLEQLCCFSESISSCLLLHKKWSEMMLTIRLNPTDIVKRLRGKRLVFVGDSLNRNMWESLVCIWRNSIKDNRKVFAVSGNRKFRAEGSYSFLFQVDMQCFWYSMFCFCFQFPENAAGAVLLFVLVWEFRTNAYVQISCCIGLQLQCWVLPLPFPCSGMGDASRTWKERGYQYLQYWALVDAWENFSGVRYWRQRLILHVMLFCISSVAYCSKYVKTS